MKCRKVAKELQLRGVATVLYSKGKTGSYRLYLPKAESTSLGTVAIGYRRGRVYVRQSGLIQDVRDETNEAQSLPLRQMSDLITALREHVQGNRAPVRNQYTGSVPPLAKD